MKRTHKILSLAMTLLIIISMAACSSGAKDKAPEMTNSASNYDMEAAVTRDAVAEEAGFTSGTSLAGGENSAATLPEKMIYSGSAEIETLEFDDTLKKLNELIEHYGGFVQSSTVTGNDYNYGYSNSPVSRRYAYYEVRIPSDQFATVTGQLETLGNVTRSSTNVENITSQYQDAEARLTVLRAQEERYLELLNMANNVEEVLYIEDYLSEVRYEIEWLETRIRSWDSLVSYSTLSLNVSEVAVYTEKEDTPYGQQLSDTFENTLKGLGSFFKAFFKFLVGALPVLVIIAAITVPTLLIVRARTRKKRAASSEKQANREE